MRKYDYAYFSNSDGTFHVLKMSDSGSGYILCDNIQNEEDAKHICEKLN